MPINLLSAGQAGATSPAALAGSLAQALAECLAALTAVNLMSPGHPAVMGLWPFVSDLRTGAMSGGSGEEGVLNAADAHLELSFPYFSTKEAPVTKKKGKLDIEVTFEVTSNGQDDFILGHQGARDQPLPLLQRNLGLRCPQPALHHGGQGPLRGGPDDVDRGAV